MTVIFSFLTVDLSDYFGAFGERNKTCGWSPSCPRLGRYHHGDGRAGAAEKDSSDTASDTEHPEPLTTCAVPGDITEPGICCSQGQR